MRAKWFNVFMLALVAALLMPLKQSHAELWSGCTGSEFGDKKAEWFGWFNSQGYGEGWLYHAEHEWLCAFGDDQSSVWLWHPTMGWLWTSQSAYPFLWSCTSGTWLYYFTGTGGWFYNCKFSINQWRAQVPVSFALIPAGEFQMGDSTGVGDWYEKPVHTVNVSAFYMGRTEVTYGQWKEVYNWAKTHGYSFSNADSGKADNHPVQEISWYDCVKWCNAKSEMEGLTPCYYTESDQINIYRTGHVDVSNDWVKWDANGYRLPTEAEWEKAARGGLVGKNFPWGDTITHDDANYYSSSRYSYDVSASRGYHPTYNDGVSPCTSPVGSFAANDYGLYDISGNVWELCWDRFYSNYYGSSPANDPRGPSLDSFPVVRGGGWGDNADFARCAVRYWCYLYDYNDIGIRLARRAGQ